MAQKTQTEQPKTLATNREAYHNYFILETYEAGVQLVGTEVKSARAGRVNLKDGYVTVRDGQAWLMNVHISHYSHGNRQNHETVRERRLLMHKREIIRLQSKTQEKGLTLVPTKFYFKGNLIKCEIGLAKGKKLYDKRETEARKTQEREARTAMKNRMRDE